MKISSVRFFVIFSCCLSVGISQTRIPVVRLPGEPDNFNNNENCTMLLLNETRAVVACSDTRPYIWYRMNAGTHVNTNCGADQDYTYESRTGSCYKFHRIGASWRHAQMTCVAEGGHLVIINNEVEAQVIREIFRRFPADKISAEMKGVVAAGFFAPAANSRYWLTVHGETLEEAGYSSFQSGQPDNTQLRGDGQYCGAVYRSGLLDDYWCNSYTSAYICEKKPTVL